MTILNIFFAILILGFIVTVHEVGHYTMGRILKIGIDEFSIGFGPKLVAWKRKGIRYSIRLLPLGGYVRYVGDDEETDDPRAMNNQRVWKRFLAILAGPVMNFLFAYLAVVVLLILSGVYLPAPIVNSVSDQSYAKELILPGDKIVSVAGEPIPFSEAGYLKMQRLIAEHGAEESIAIGIDRSDMLITIETRLIETEDGPRIGIGMGMAIQPVGFAESFPLAWDRIVMVTGEMIGGLRNLFFRGEGLEDTMGPVGIVTVVSEQISRGVDEVIWLIIIISLNLGIINLLPLPALDGGRLTLLIVEGIRRKPIDRNKEGMIHLIGLGLLFTLIIVLTYRDIARLITGG